MTAREHPDYAEEEQHLDRTLTCVRAYLAEHGTPLGYGGDNRAAQESLRVILQRVQEMKNAEKSAYFGRIDVLHSDAEEPEVMYFGYHQIPDINVYSWRGPVAARFYLQESGQAGSSLLLKRTLVIRGDDIESITDDFVDPRQEAAFQRRVTQFTDTLLFDLLQASRGGQLRDIVATIQKQQYQIIQSPEDTVLIVQGVTGSGKTDLALHRVAYLLYRHHDSKDWAAKNLLILGPNRVFLGYISKVLPVLGEHQVPQRTFDEWLIERLGADVEHEPQELALEALLDPALPLSERAMRYRNAFNKGSLQMADLLERYVAILHDDLLAGRDALTCAIRPRPSEKQPESDRVLQAEVAVDQLREMLNNARHLPFNQRRDEVKKQVIGKLQRELRSQVTRPSFREDSLTSRIDSTVRGQVDKYFADWRAQNVSVAYRRLLRNPDLLQRAGEGIFSDWDLELLTQDAPTALTPFRFSDLAPLLYLRTLLDGQEGALYEHIVIDEAQDISPMHFKVLHNYSRTGSMTVLGDLAQGIYPYHGISDWEELRRSLGEQAVTQATIQQSYRSTSQIIEYANAMQRRVGVGDDRLAQPIARKGPQPNLSVCENGAARARLIVETVQADRASARESIAIVGKTAAMCRQLKADIAAAGLTECQLITERQAQYLGQTVIIPSYLTKGLEFDSVIVADADAASYGSDELDARLMYVVLTRAAHTLHIFWIGGITPLLDEQLVSVELRPFLAGGLEPRPVTVEEYTTEHPEMDPDWCVERLASAGKLSLLPQGRIDDAVLAAILRRQQTAVQRSDEELSVEPLGPTARRELNEQVANLETSPEPAIQEALAVTQLAFGLLKNQMRSVGLPVAEEDRTPLAEQVAMLVTLFRAVRQNNASLSVGRWTTAHRALFAVSELCRAAANQHLAQFIEYGIVEESMRTGRSWIRVSPDWIPGLLAFGLGYPSTDWDPDLVKGVPTLPHPLG